MDNKTEPNEEKTFHSHYCRIASNFNKLDLTHLIADIVVSECFTEMVYIANELINIVCNVDNGQTTQYLADNVTHILMQESYEILKISHIL